jgi:uncharacterized protein with HEPN domain
MSKHPDRAQDYLEHILGALERIQRYTAAKSATDFSADTLLQDAVLRNLGIIGEAAHRLLAHLALSIWRLIQRLRLTPSTAARKAALR